MSIPLDVKQGSRFDVDDVEFIIDIGAGATRGKSEDNKFVICKNAEHMAYYSSLKADRPRTILEIGMFEGGSMVLWDKMFNPSCLVGIDRRAEPIEPLENYRADKPYIKTYYSHSQEKKETLIAARDNFPDGIDLVIDDASHLYDQTKATFEQIFPLVRAGGIYVIEDWAWAHRPGAQKPEHPWASRAAMTNLIFELVVLTGGSAAISSLHIEQGLVAIRKGSRPLRDGALDGDKFLRGRTLEQI